MSTLLRILLMAVAWLVFFLVTFYGCIKPTCCPDGDSIGTVAPVPVDDDDQTTAVATDDYSIVSRLGQDDVLTGAQWPAMREDLLRRFNAEPDQVLEVYGNYYSAETAPEGFENMGFYRAQQIKDILVSQTDIPADNIKLLARRIDEEQPDADALWPAGRFNIKAGDTGTTGINAEESSEVIQLDDDEIIIRFPFNDARKEVDPAVDDYLDKLAQRLQQTNEQVQITGHTDNIGSDAANQRLGQQRADFIKQILVDNGANAASITTSSRGESDPTDTNETEAGRRNNRRAIVRLNRAQ